MEEIEVFDRVKKIVVAQLGVAPDSVTVATSFTKDVGADQIAVIKLEFALGEEFGIEIPDADVLKSKQPEGAPINFFASRCLPRAIVCSHRAARLLENTPSGATIAYLPISSGVDGLP